MLNAVLDPTFGQGGIVKTPVTSYLEATATAMQKDGKIVSVGTTSIGIIVVRYNSNGSVDEHFGTNGVSFVHFGTDPTTGFETGSGKAVAIQPNGKIIVVAYLPTSTSTDFALARLDASGNTDYTFGVYGKVITSFPSTPSQGRCEAIPESVAVQANGRIVVAGTINIPKYDFALARYDTNGALDATFGTGGQVVTDLGGFADFAYAMALQSDGKIVVAGTSQVGITTSGAVARYNHNGSLDSTFGSGGKVIQAGVDAAFALAIQGNGKIVVAGYTSFNGGGEDLGLMRVNANGGLDTTFGSNGIVLSSFASNTFATSVAIDSQGNIVVAGAVVTPSPTGSKYDFFVARYHANGQLDTGFAPGGNIITDLGGYDSATNVFVRNGKIVVAGQAGNDFALVRWRGNTM